MAAARARAGATLSPGAVQPLYVRRPDAELARDREALAHSTQARDGAERP
jgi:hypothetical protein